MKSITIKKGILGVCCLFATGVLLSQESLTTAQWQEDVDFLQETVHNDFPFLFKKIDKEKWDGEVARFRESVPNLEPHEVEVGLTRMVSLFEYGHTQIPFSTLAKEAVLPVNLYHFNDGVYIEGVTKAHGKTLGAKVIKVGNVPVIEALAKVRPVVPVENDQYFKAYGLRFLTVPAVLHAQGVIPNYSENVTLTLEKDGKRFDYTFPAIALDQMSRDYNFTIPNENWLSARQDGETPLYLKKLNDAFYYFEYNPETKALYARQSSVFNDPKETIADFYKRLFEFIDTHEIERLVYDVRLNGGGNNYNNKNFIKGMMARPDLNTKGKFFYIIGRNTFSACQNLTNEVENYTEAIIVGEPTAENKNFYGDARKVTLPNSKMNAYLSYAWWQDLPAWENKDWTLPNIAVDMSFKDYVNNQDPVLDAALSYTDTGFILDPLEHLTQLFVQGKYDELKTESAKIAKDPAYKYYNFKEEFGAAGYRLFQNGSTDAGLFILQLVTDNYPESASSWYSLAGALEQTKQYDKAIAAYEKIITLKPEGALLQTAKEKLEALRKK